LAECFVGGWTAGRNAARLTSWEIEAEAVARA
jgi:hypothetical protein